MPDERVLVAGGSVVAALLVFFLSCVSHANPVRISYTNPGTTVYESVTIFMPGLSPQVVPSACSPGFTCNAYVCAPPGEYTGITATAQAGGQTSGISNQTTASVPAPTACSFDLDRNGRLNTADFGAFLNDFYRGCWTTADYGVFMTRFGKPSCQ